MNIKKYSVINVNEYNYKIIYISGKQHLKYFVCSHNLLLTPISQVTFFMGIKMKNTTPEPLRQKWTGPIDKSRKFHSDYMC